MAETGNCPKCGSQLPPNAPAGICPKCLLAAGLESDPASAWDAKQPASTTPASGFVPPEPGELAEYFPLLDILELLGKGGMGAVYKARQRDLDRLVAVKILPPEVGTDPAFKERFTREARALAKLSHQNIVALYDFGQADGLYYFIMEYVDGPNLRQLIASGDLKPEEALAIVPQICEALQFAHDEGVVHRDIKPENILVARRGHVKIADFGLAKLLVPGSDDRELTGTHQVMGTLHYMAPEQMRRSQGVDHRADIYSLGVVFYEMLTGQLPLGRFALPSTKVPIDTRLDDIVLRSLESEPDDRYQHASEVETDIRNIAKAIPPRIAPKLDASVVDAPPRFSRKAIFAALWAPFFFFAVFCFFFTKPSHPVPVVEPAPVVDSSTGEVVPMDESAIPRRLDYPYPGGSRSQTVVLRPRTVQHQPAVPRWAWFLAVTVLPLGLTAPFGTTILGMVAISNIRHSRGRVTGLPLAVADALLYPLLILDLLTLVFVGTICVVVVQVLNLGPGFSYYSLMGIAGLFGVPVCVGLDVLIIYATWRKAAAPLAG